VLQVGEDVFTARVCDGTLRPSMGAAPDAVLRVELDMETFFALSSGALGAREAVASGRARLDGEPEALERCFRVLSIAPRTQAARPGDCAPDLV
jgi:putative sterol carrier protein